MDRGVHGRGPGRRDGPGSERGWNSHVVRGAVVLVCAVALAGGVPAISAATGTLQESTVDNGDVTAIYDGEISERPERINDVERTPDGGLLAVQVSGGDEVESTILRVDASGSVAGRETVPGALESLRRVDEDAYVAAGVQDDDVYVARIGVDGGVVWTDTYGGDGRDLATDVASAPGGDAYVLATTNSFGAETSDLWALRVAPDGEVVWEERLAHEKWTAFPMGERLADGSLVAAIRTERSMDKEVDGDQNVSVVRLTPDGEVTWRTLVVGEGTVDKDEVFEVVPAHGDGVLLAGTSNSGNDRWHQDFWAVRVDSTGEVLWQRDYETETDEIASAAFRTGDGYLLAGFSGSDDRTDRGRVVAIDTDGERRFAATYDRGAGIDADLDTWMVAGDWTTDGELALGGIAMNSESEHSQAWIADFRDALPPVEPGPSAWETQHGADEQSDSAGPGGSDGSDPDGTAVEDVDSPMGSLLYAAAVVSTGLLVVPYGIRRFRRR